MGADGDSPELGVDKYKPRHLGQVIGNTDLVRKLAEWLRDWDDVVLRGKTKEAKEEPGTEWMRFKPAPDNINAKAALISGPPGIGKTTTSTLVARCCRKYKLMEFNASDARSKKVIENMSQTLAGNHTLKFGAADGGALERTVIIMDECDGMSGGGDIGGMAALINMIKMTKSPIICICNDRSDAGVRKLADHCLDLKFRRPDKTMIAKRIKVILEGEGKRVDVAALEATSEACGHDIRQVINQMQFFGTMAAASGVSQKDTQVMLSPFDACTKLFDRGSEKKKALSLDKKLDMFYIDADLMPLMVQENYLRALEKPRVGEDEETTMGHCAYGAELIATADSMYGDWSLMNTTAAIGTLYPSFLVSNDGAMKPTFPAWLQKRGPQNKAQRVVQEMHSRLRAVTTTSSRMLAVSSYHDILHRRLLQPLTFGDAKGCAAQLAAIGLTREFFTDQAPTLRVPLGLEDGYKKVEGGKKAQLLQELQNLQPKVAAPVKRKRQDDGLGGDDAGEEAPAEEDDTAGGMFKKKKTTRKSAGGQEKTASSGGAGSGGAKAKAKSKASLATWKKVVDEGDAGGEAGEVKKKAQLILKFIEGHTNAVRRKVHIHELLQPWRDF